MCRRKEVRRCSLTGKEKPPVNWLSEYRAVLGPAGQRIRIRSPGVPIPRPARCGPRADLVAEARSEHRYQFVDRKGGQLTCQLQFTSEISAEECLYAWLPEGPQIVAAGGGAVRRAKQMTICGKHFGLVHGQQNLFRVTKGQPLRSNDLGRKRRVEAHRLFGREGRWKSVDHALGAHGSTRSLNPDLAGSMIDETYFRLQDNVTASAIGRYQGPIPFANLPVQVGVDIAIDVMDRNGRQLGAVHVTAHRIQQRIPSTSRSRSH